MSTTSFLIKINFASHPKSWCISRGSDGTTSIKSFLQNNTPAEQGFYFQFRDRLFNIDDTTLLHELDGFVSGSIIYVFKRTVVADVIVNGMEAFNLEGGKVERSDGSVVGKYVINFTFTWGMPTRMEEVPPFALIARLMSKFEKIVNSDFPTSMPRGLTFQFRDKVLYSTAGGFGEGFSDDSVVRDIPGLVDGCCIYVYESTP